ncbi:MAG: TetR/AcrR family transcriptional regulator [Propionibacteriaceae bacterium]|nr:TetR/AcrR family transcriptional regulator [Propionibacteriaceae bacterium]
MSTRAPDRETQILRASLRLFLDKGFHGTSTREICRSVGISSGLFFHYFPTKQAVYEHLVGIACRQMVLDLDAADADPLAYLGRLLARFIGLLERDRRNAALFVFMAQVQRHPGISPVVDALLDEHDLVRTTLPVFVEAQRRGHVRPGDPLALSTALWSAVQGLAEEVALHPEHPLPDAAWYLDLVRAPGGTVSPA